MSFEPTDTTGLPVRDLTLSLDHGWMGLNVGAYMADLLWAAQRFVAWIALGVLNVVSEFAYWMGPIVNLLERLSDAMYSMAGMIGLFGLAVAVGVLVFVTHWLRGTTHKIAHHLGMALILTMTGVAMVSPVRWAVAAVDLGGGAAREVGSAVVGQPDVSISQVLATKYLREPMQRSVFGRTLDTTGSTDGRTCGAVYNAAVLNPRTIPDTDAKGELLETTHVESPREAVQNFCGIRPNTDNLFFDLLVNGTLVVVLSAFVIVIAVRLVRTAVATILHAAAIKPLLLTVAAGPATQVYTLRNMIAIPMGMLAVFADLLVLVGVAAVNVIALQANADNAALAGVVTALLMAGLVFGTWHFTRNLQGHGKRWAEQTAQARIAQHDVSVQQARQMVTKAVASPAQVSRGLSKALAGTAGRVPVPQFGWGPRSESILHDRGHYDSLPGAPGQPGLPGVAGRDASPVSAAAATAERIHERIVRETHQIESAVSMNGDRPAVADPEHARHQVVKELSRPPESLPPPPVQHAVRERKPAQIPILGENATRRALDAVRATRRRKKQ